MACCSCTVKAESARLVGTGSGQLDRQDEAREVVHHRSSRSNFLADLNLVSLRTSRCSLYL